MPQHSLTLWGTGGVPADIVKHWSPNRSACVARSGTCCVATHKRCSVLYSVITLYNTLRPTRTLRRNVQSGGVVASPTIEAITNFTRDQLVMIVGHYKIEVTGSLAKADLLEVLIDTLSVLGCLESVSGEGPIYGPKPGSRTPEHPTEPSVSMAELELRRFQLREGHRALI